LIAVSADEQELVKGSDLVAKFLADREIRHVFGIIGAGNAHIFDSITRLGYTEIVCVHHEQAAVMAMNFYTRTSGKPCATLVTTGGGAANAFTGVVSGWMDSTPGVVIAGNEHSKHTRDDNDLRIWGVQGYDSVGAVKGITKYASRLLDPNAIYADLAEAFEIAEGGRPGPVWLEIPMDIQAAKLPVADMKAPRTPGTLGAEKPPLAGDALRRVAEGVADRIAQAERPLLWLGQGIRLAGEGATAGDLVTELGIPTLESWNALDLVDANNPLIFGHAGVYGQRSSNLILQNCDCLLTIGTRLAIPQVGYEISEFARAADVMSVDIDPLELDKYADRLAMSIHADAGAFVVALRAVLLERSGADSNPSPAHRTWIGQCDAYRHKYPTIGPEHTDTPGFINSYRFLREYEKHFHPDQVVVTDMGTALLSAFGILDMGEDQRLITSTGLGEMGVGLPGAVGASFARDRGEVLCLNCDGGMMMNLQELQTIAHHKLPIKIIVFNNDGYLMIKHTQKAIFRGVYAGTDRASGVSCPDFAKLATAFDMPSFAIHTWDDVDAVLPEFQAVQGPAICEVFMDPEQFFLPKLSVATRPDGTLVSPPIEDLSPLLPRDELAENMIIGLHPKSAEL
jgi:acetolactate synthase-1/2/3 large subunit